ncbi:MAG: hypothetical protein WCV62_01175 [Candidatus Peribacteraceae bacterium]|jgi:hypothetical protein
MNHGFSREELAIIRPCNTPRKIQDFLCTIPHNFEHGKHTCLSPRQVLRERRAHCVEGAALAAAMLRVAGWRPLVMDLRAVGHDFDHVIALFRIDGCWGAISKTNHGVLRYREAVYRSVRELALSFFHEYFLDNGEKTLRSYSGAIDLSRFDAVGWMAREGEIWDIYAHIDAVRHYPILTRAQIARLRRADPIERRMGKLSDWPHPRKRKTVGDTVH